MKKIYIAPLTISEFVKEQELIATSLVTNGLDGINTEVIVGLDNDDAEVKEFLWEEDIWDNAL